MPLSRIATAVAVAVLVVFGVAGRADAHGMRTAYLEIVEHEPGRALARFRLNVPAPGVAPRFPSECGVRDAGSGAPPESADVEASWHSGLTQGGSTFLLECPGSLAGRTVGVIGLGTGVSEAVVWFSQRGAPTSSHLVTAASPSVRLPHMARPLTSFLEYGALGLKHIVEGADHLLFLLLLVLTLRRASAVLWAETAFTLSHSLSFSAAALGWIHVSKEAAEACIAWSLLLLALDASLRGARAVSTRDGAATALLFGLVHGLGFADGLREIGVPERNVAWALLGFGAGVEVGQVAFLVVALGGSYLLARSRFYLSTVIVSSYAAGGLAAFWLIERVIQCFGAPR